MDGFHYPPVDGRIMRCGIYLTSVGRLTYKPGESYPVSGHPERFDFEWSKGRSVGDHVLLMIDRGVGEFELADGVRHEVSAGDILYIVPGQWHRYRPLATSGWTERWICLNGAALHGLRAAGVLPTTATLTRDGLEDSVLQRFDRLLLDVVASPHHNQPSWGARAMALLLECFGDSEPVPPAATGSTAPGAAEALRFISENCHRPIRVEDVARHCGLERRTLVRRFAAAFPHGVAGAIIRNRIERAEMLLRSTTLPVKEVAYACGFGSPQRMIYDFRKHRGITPGGLRGNGD